MCGEMDQGNGKQQKKVRVVNRARGACMGRSADQVNTRRGKEES